MTLSLGRQLQQAAAAFGAVRVPHSPELVLARLVDHVAPHRSSDVALPVELVYEGYLVHYRTSRVLPPETTDPDRLLAGDFLYAHGLRAIAASGDVEAVNLLARLMSLCSVLRLEGAAWSIDDDLWELTVSAVAAGRGSDARAAASRAFADVGASVSAGDVKSASSAAEAGLAAVRSVVAVAAAEAR